MHMLRGHTSLLLHVLLLCVFHICFLAMFFDQCGFIHVLWHVHVLWHLDSLPPGIKVSIYLFTSSEEETQMKWLTVNALWSKQGLIPATGRIWIVWINTLKPHSDRLNIIVGWWGIKYPLAPRSWRHFKGLWLVSCPACWVINECFLIPSSNWHFNIDSFCCCILAPLVSWLVLSVLFDWVEPTGEINKRCLFTPGFTSAAGTIPP